MKNLYQLARVYAVHVIDNVKCLIGFMPHKSAIKINAAMLVLSPVVATMVALITQDIQLNLYASASVFALLNSLVLLSGASITVALFIKKDGVLESVMARVLGVALLLAVAVKLLVLRVWAVKIIGLTYMFEADFQAIDGAVGEALIAALVFSLLLVVLMAKLEHKEKNLDSQISSVNE
jgi:hypothetical protein